jgi:tRNA-2-methylthio-N6-dimethylallyladenosine synthase
MNVYDSSRMGEVLAGAGYKAADRAEDADLVVLNTCHIREKAGEKVYSELGRFKDLKARRPGMKFAVAGCVAQAEGAEISRRAPIVDLVVGPQSYHNLPQLLRLEAGQAAVDTTFAAAGKFASLKSSRAPLPSPAAFLTIQEGCDKFCTFCVVPYTRGSEVSRSMAQIAAEARDLVARGAREITLLGQNVNAWTHGGSRLADLIGHLSGIEGLERIRYTTSHPRDMDEALIRAHAEYPKLMPQLHLPVQSGSDRILRAMNRRHSAADYLDLVARIRAAQPAIALSSDFIVGFPGETEEDFASTLDLVEATGFAMAYSFLYSARPGTPASGRPGVDPAIAHDRLLRLQAMLTRQQLAAQSALVGTLQPVLVEKPGREPGQVVGKSPSMHAVHFPGDHDLIGKTVQVRILRSEKNTLGAEIEASSPPPGLSLASGLAVGQTSR